MLLEQQGKMAKILVIYIPSKYWDLLILSQGPEDHNPQDQCCGNQQPCNRSVTEKIKFTDTSHWNRGNIHEKTYTHLQQLLKKCSTKLPDTVQIHA